MSLIQNIRQPISSEMQAFNDRFKMEFVSENKILTTINSYILQTTGKQLRPILTILSAKICGEINQSTIDGAIALELLHTASLIHDDVVDNSLKRRGHLSVNAHGLINMPFLPEIIYSLNHSNVLQTQKI